MKTAFAFLLIFAAMLALGIFIDYSYTGLGLGAVAGATIGVVMGSLVLMTRK